MAFRLETRRLQLLPLDLPQLHLQMDDPRELATSLGLSPQLSQIPDPELQSALAHMILSLEERPQDWLWSTNWLIISLLDRMVVGGCAFHGPANPDGEVEVGYGLAPAFRGKGYMTEAIECLINWAFTQDNIAAITAETDKDNLPSQHVLNRLGLHVVRENDTSLWWRVDKSEWLSSEELRDGST
jgi:ribosomal-protein-alanine N-acetyltransferase